MRRWGEVGGEVLQSVGLGELWLSTLGALVEIGRASWVTTQGGCCGWGA